MGCRETLDTRYRSACSGDVDKRRLDLSNLTMGAWCPDSNVALTEVARHEDEDHGTCARDDCFARRLRWGLGWAGLWLLSLFGACGALACSTTCACTGSALDVIYQFIEGAVGQGGVGMYMGGCLLRVRRARRRRSTDDIMRMLLLCRAFQLGDAYSTRCKGREERLAFLGKSVVCA